jgi:hypothetical protein
MSSSIARRTAALTVLTVATASGAALTGAVASAQTHHKAHTSLSIRTVRGAVNPGGGDVVRGQLQAFDHHNAGRRIVLLARTAGATSWTKTARHRSGKHGQVAFQVAPASTTRYQLAFAGNNRQQASHSGVVTVRVLDTTSLPISVGASSIESGQSTTVNGVLSLDGSPLVGQTVKLLGAVRHHKLSYQTSAVTGDDGSVSFPVTPAATSHYRLVFTRTTDYPGAKSSVATVHVRVPSSLSIRARHGKHGNEIISGDLRGSGHGLAHRKVTLQDRASGTTAWTTVKSKVTKRHGLVGFAVPAKNVSEDYQLVFAGGPFHDGCQSGVVTVTVG